MSISNELWLSRKTKLLGYNLIKQLNVGMGFGLAGYLHVNHCYNNHEAVLVWLEHFLTENPEIDNFNSIKTEFLKYFPESSYVIA